MNQHIWKQFLRFAIVGGIGFIVDFGFTLSLIATGIDAFVARIIAIGLAMLTTWRLNRVMTFGASGSSQVSEGARYFLVALTVALINYAIYAGLLLALPDIFPGIAVIIAVGVATGLSFTGYRVFAFRQSA